jgi:hypothetical protein
VTTPLSLAEFLAQATRTPFAWGRRDCCLWVADWLVARGHPDPAARLRGRYATEAEAERALFWSGGLVRVVEGAALGLGLAPTEAPVAGAIGLVEIAGPAGVTVAAGICTGDRWAVLAEGGLLTFTARPLAAWSV